MNLASVTHESLSTQLEMEVPEVVVVVAKHRVAGVDSESIADVIGCDVKDIEEVESTEIYKTVRQVIGALVAGQQADQGFVWDSIESIAAKNLLERLEYERDPEFLLKAAATANKMTRRNQPVQGGLLEPGGANKRAAVVLTRRLVERITSSGHRQVVEEQQLSIHDGSMKTPTFDEIDGFLGVTPKVAPKRINVSDSSDSLTLDQLDRQMQERDS